jgi:NAD(P)H-dependent FMN reductase
VHNRNELRRRLEEAKARYREELARERQLLEQGFSGRTAKESAEKHSRLIEQHSTVMMAIAEYEAAVNAVLEASGVNLKRG